MLNNQLVDALPEEIASRAAAEILAPVARAAAERNCRLGFYNHGGWWGEPDNQIRVLKALRKMGFDNVGLVYNFHHGHEHVTKFSELARRMQPYLLTVNINGMRDGGPQILPVGKGSHEAAMLRDLERRRLQWTNRHIAPSRWSRRGNRPERELARHRAVALDSLGPTEYQLRNIVEGTEGFTTENTECTEKAKSSTVERQRWTCLLF